MYNEARVDLFRSLDNLFPNFLDLTDTNKTNLLLYGEKCLSHDVNKQILLTTLNYCKETKRFS